MKATTMTGVLSARAQRNQHRPKSPPRPQRWSRKPQPELAYLEASLNPSSRRRRQPRMPATEPQRRSLEPSWAQRPVLPSLMQWSGASRIARRKRPTSAPSWTRRTSSGRLRATSQGPRPNQSYPCRPHNPPTTPLRSQYTATLMLSRITLLHRRVVSTVVNGKSMLSRTIRRRHHYTTSTLLRSSLMLSHITLLSHLNLVVCTVALDKLSLRRPPTTRLLKSPRLRQLHPWLLSMCLLHRLLRLRRGPSTVLPVRSPVLN